MQVSAASLADAGLTKDYIEKIRPVGVVRGATKARLPADGTACTGSLDSLLQSKAFITTSEQKNIHGDDVCDEAIAWGLGIKKGAAEPELLEQEVSITSINPNLVEEVGFKTLFPVPSEDFR